MYINDIHSLVPSITLSLSKSIVFVAGVVIVITI